MSTSIRLRRNIARFYASSAILAAGASTALAQEKVYQLDPIYLEANDPYYGAADRATSMYVSGLELEQARTGDLKDVFSGVASVSVGGALPLTQKIYVNGVDMLNLGVTIDGTAQNNRAFHHVTANAIDPGLLKQVRADATISPADAGPYALAGSVVFETVDPEDILDPDQRFGGNARLSYDDNGKTAQAALTLAGQADGLSWLAYGKRATGDDYKAGDGTVMKGTAADLTSGLAKVAYETDTGHRFELSGQRLHDDALRQFRANFGSFYGDADSLRRYDTTRDSYAFQYRNTQADGMWDPEIRIGYSESDIVVPTPYDSNGKSGTWSATVQNTFNLGGEDNIVAGLDWQDRFGEYTSPLYGEHNEEGSRNIGLFAQARMDLNDRTRLSTGLRADRQDFDGVDGSDLSNSGLSGNVSLSYALTDSLTLRGGVSSVFGGIDIEDNYTYLPSWRYDNLQPARAENATVGFDWTQGSLLIGGELFVTRIDNARSAEQNFDFESRGFNLGAQYGWNSGSARVTLSHSEVEVDGVASGSYEALDFGAPLGTVMALEVEQQTSWDGLRVGGSVEAALDYDMPAGSEADLKDYTVVNLFAEYTPARQDDLTIRAEVRNLFDTDYADRATYGQDYRDIGTLKESGRSLSLILVQQF
ncbi:TonB-dependent receptor domain-containing protein [Paracoccus homiensis]|uniref:Hemoglobin/transferrin/lactoferrin receptor protein n=1 Tax=Paracoccus homiensis TaxID=364199 RepID=A0A1I0JG33_9RHOB|nr:TonB-dependent receptor [Paracoccus homiensis]SEU08422.1 hemoglobin/transferrin/lactoferrin receptor protein [Paracoccus homiensis]